MTHLLLSKPMLEPELVQSSLSQSIEVEGKSLRIEIYKMEDEAQWTLEIEHEDGSSLVWDELFDTDFLALNEARQTLAKDGLSAFTNAEEAQIPEEYKTLKAPDIKPEQRLSEQLKQLDDFLLSDAVPEDCMTMSELDGFLAAVVVCPEMIMPSEWVPEIWGSDEPVFDDMEQAQMITGAIMSRYNDVIKELDADDYGPIFDYDEYTEETLWEIWADGFFRGISLRSDAWSFENNAEAQQTFTIFMRLYELTNRPRSEIKPLDGDDQLLEIAPDVICHTVYELHKGRKNISANPFQAANQNKPKVGRNDPCPCGSGKKFKKCCLH
jgi:uncharacterized protein